MPGKQGITGPNACDNSACTFTFLHVETGDHTDSSVLAMISSVTVGYPRIRARVALDRVSTMPMDPFSQTHVKVSHSGYSSCSEYDLISLAPSSAKGWLKT